jgi:uncharacterized OB-fold protein
MLTKTKKLRKPCRICGEMYVPTGKAETLCQKCFYKARETIHKKGKRKKK